MDIDRNSEMFILTEDESQAIRLPKYREWHIGSARRLMEITETELSRVDDLDPSVTPFIAERYRLMAEKQKNSHLLRRMLDQLGPFASEDLANEAADYLRDLDS